MTHRFLPHTADICVELEAGSLEGLFHEATTVVRGLLAGATDVGCAVERDVSVASSGADELLHHYVRELLTIFQVDTFVPAQLEVHHLTPTELKGTVAGEAFDERRHEPQPEVKAVTRHELRVEPVESGWRGMLVFDM